MLQVHRLTRSPQKILNFSSCQDQSYLTDTWSTTISNSKNITIKLSYFNFMHILYTFTCVQIHTHVHVDARGQSEVSRSGYFVTLLCYFPPLEQGRIVG